MTSDRSTDPDSPASESTAIPPSGPFYRGTIVAVHYGSGQGLIRTGSGHEVRFVVPFVEFLDARKIFDLMEGMEVGFDVGWTSRGLRVTKIKID